MYINIISRRVVLPYFVCRALNQYSTGNSSEKTSTSFADPGYLAFRTPQGFRFSSSMHGRQNISHWLSNRNSCCSNQQAYNLAATFKRRVLWEWRAYRFHRAPTLAGSASMELRPTAHLTLLRRFSSTVVRTVVQE